MEGIQYRIEPESLLDEHDFIQSNMRTTSREDSGLGGLLQRNIDVSKPYFEEQLRRLYHSYITVHRKDQQASKWQNLPKSVFNLPMIPPDCTFTLSWTAFMLVVDLIYTAFWVPLDVAFCSINYGDLSDGCTQVQLAGGCVYLVNMLLSFQIGVVLVNKFNKIPTVDGRVSAAAYVLYGWFWLDLISVIPLFYLIGVLIHQSTLPKWVVYVSLLRVLRMIRSVAVSKLLYLDASSGHMNKLLQDWFGGTTGAMACFLAYIFCVMINFQACLLLIVSYLKGTDNSFLASFTWLDAVDAPRAEQWYMAIYMVILTNTGTGSWGIQVSDMLEMVVFNFFMLVGIVMFGVLLALMLLYMTTLSNDVRSAHQLSIKLRRVDRFIRSNALPTDLASDLKNFYRTDWIKRDEQYKENFQSELPCDKRVKASQASLHPLMEALQFFSSIGEEAQMFLGSRMISIDVEAGFELCCESEGPECLWLLERGMVQAVDLSCKTQHTLLAPAMFGDAILVSDIIPSCRDRLFGYRTDSPCRLWRLSLREMTSSLRVCPGVRAAYLSFVQMTLLQLLTGYVSDLGSCEIVAHVMLVLEKVEGEIKEEVVQQLQQANQGDGSLQVLLNALLELSITRTTRGRIDGIDLERALSSASEATSERPESFILGDGDLCPFPAWPEGSIMSQASGSSAAERVIARLSRQLLSANSRRGTATSSTGGAGFKDSSQRGSTGGHAAGTG